MAAAGGLSVAFPRHASATTDSWIGTAGGNWSDGTRWSAGVAPTAGQDVLITNAFSGSQTITFDSSAGLTYNSLNIDATNGGTNVFLMAANNLNSAGETVGIFGSAIFTQTSGTNSMGGDGGLFIGGHASTTSSYNLGAGASLLAANSFEKIGFGGNGIFNQSGGSNTITGTSFFLILGTSAPGVADGTGSYTLSGGSLTVSTGTEYIGDAGRGNFLQSDGTNTYASLVLGNSNTASGSYALSGGSLVAGQTQYIGYSGTGDFNQSGGSNSLTANTNLYIGFMAGSTGSYTLSAGTLGDNSGFEYIGYHGVGSFNQTGGTNSLTGGAGLIMGTYAGPSGTYTLSGGTLSAGSSSTETVGEGQGSAIFNQTGGINSLSSFSTLYGGHLFGSTGFYTMGSGATFNTATSFEDIGFNGLGYFNQAGGVHTLTGSSYLTLGYNANSTGNYTLGSGATLAVTNSYEYIGNSGTGNFNQTGGVNSITGTGAFILGFHAGATGSYTLGGGTLVSTNSYEYIGNGGVGNFNQTGGTNSLSGSSRLYLAAQGGSTGNYTLGGGLLSAVNSPEYIGLASQGNFNQTGGTNSVSSTISSSALLSVGTNPGGSGTYSLSAGLLNVTNGNEVVGDLARGNLIQSGGSNTYANLYLGNGAAASGSYSLSGGILKGTSGQYIGYLGTGDFNQSGGTNSYNQSGGTGGFSVAYGVASTGTYTLSAGMLSVNTAENIGVQGHGSFNQSGGTNSFNFAPAYLVLGNSNSATGSYTLSNGALNAGLGEFVGYSGLGSFNQSGGTNTFIGGYPLILGYFAGGTGNYALSGGMFNANGSPEYVGQSGAGTFNQSGGTNTGSMSVYLGHLNGSSGTYNLSAGMLSSSFESIGAGLGTFGNFNQSGGTNALSSSNGATGDIVGSDGGTGVYTLTGGLLVAGSRSQIIGDGSRGIFNQSGGTNSFSTGSVNLGYLPGSSGTYTLSGGSVSGNLENVGSSGTADFNQSGGTNAPTGIYLGFSSGSTGTYVLTGGNLSVGASAFIGGDGKNARGIGNLSVSGSAQLNVAHALTIFSTGSVTITGNTNTTLGSLQISPAGSLAMDGPHASVLINYGNLANPTASIRQYLQNGYNGGNWDAGGMLPNPTAGAITSATAAASSAFSIGYADGSDGVVAGLSGGQEEIKFTYGGDANLDGQVNLSDLTILANHFGSTGVNWDQGDFSYDGSVNLSDLTLLASHFGDGVGNPLQDAQIHAQFAQDLEILESTDPAFATDVSRLVPEPSSIALLTIAGIGLLKRRSRIAAKKKD
jgi:hypothetical protein